MSYDIYVKIIVMTLSITFTIYLGKERQIRVLQEPSVFYNHVKWNWGSNCVSCEEKVDVLTSLSCKQGVIRFRFV